MKIVGQLRVETQQEIFSHKDGDGTIRSFMVGTMKNFISDYPHCSDLKYAMSPINQQVVDYIRSNVGAEQDRVDRLRAPYLHEPGIGILWGDDEKEFTMVDGNHRAIKLFERGKNKMKVVLFRYPFWENFLLPETVKNRIMDERDIFNSPSGVIEFERKKLSC